MNDPIFHIRENNVITVLSFSLLSLLCAWMMVSMIVEKDTPIWAYFAGLGGLFTVVAFALDSALHTISIYDDRITNKSFLSKSTIYFKDIHHIIYTKEMPSANEGDLAKNYYFLTFRDQNKKEVDRLSLHAFNSTSELQQFLTIIQQYQSHISFDRHVQEMVNGTFRKPNRTPFLLFIVVLIIIGFVLYFNFIK